MADAYCCPNCGFELPPGTPQGSCPRCRTLDAPSGIPLTRDDDVTSAGANRPAGGDATEPALVGAEAAWAGAREPAPSATDATVDRPGDPDALTAAGGDDGTPALARGATVRYFGDYEIRTELGRGGMGVVYEARQVSLNRPVALKMVRAGLLADGDELRRFKNEAEAVALLDHHAIVPVYEVGEYDGQHYFSMKLVPGGSLVPRLDRYQHNPRAAALLAAEIAEAVQHAHMRGILHRDLKPANILLDAEGHPHITDFGLAKRVEADAELTASGAILGTPAYMAPEQATGHRGSITLATDVYGLGAVLYALLTGRGPFGGNSAIATLDAVRHHAPEPPTRVNVEVPRDLETICLKCLEKDPRRRYATAQALADDLRAWLESRPIAARRVGSAERAWLWCRRRPAVAALSAAVLLAVVTGTAATIAVQATANRALGRKNADLTEALGREATANIALAAANRRVEERYGLAVDAIKTFHTGVSEDFLLKEEPFKDLRDRLLKSAADFYGKLGASLGKESDAASRRALYQANFELADLTGMVGRDEDALEAHQTVLAARRALAAEPGAEVGTRTDRGRSHTRVAALLEQAGKTTEALAAYREAEALLTGLASQSPEARAALADCQSHLGWLLSRTGKNAEALAAYRLALADQEALAAAPAATNNSRRDLAATIDRIGLLLGHTGKPAEAEAELRRALLIRQKLAADNPAVADFHSRLAESHYNLGTLLSDTGRPEAGEAEYRRALLIQQELAAKNSAVTEFRARVADSHNNLAFRLFRRGKPALAEAELRQAVAIRRKLGEDHPTVAEFRNRLAVCHNNLGNVLWATNRPAEAQAEYRRALLIQQELVEQNPAVTDFRNRLAGSHNNLANLLTTTGQRPTRRPSIARRFHSSGCWPTRIPS